VMEIKKFTRVGNLETVILYEKE
jgi:hypothetical protein